MTHDQPPSPLPANLSAIAPNRVATPSLSRRGFLTNGAAALAGLATSTVSATFESSNAAPLLYHEVPKEFRDLTFLFQGDSITDGNWGRNQSDKNHYLGHGFAAAVSMRLGADFPTAGFKFLNRGNSGNAVSDLEKRWERDALKLKPDVLTVLIGVNDVGRRLRHPDKAYDAEEFERRYRALLQKSRQANPKLVLVLGAPWMFKVGSHIKQWDFWSKAVPPFADAVRRLAAEFDAVFIDFPAMFEKAARIAPIEHWSWDGCHPSYSGHELMAREWLTRTAPKLPFLRAYHNGSITQSMSVIR